MEHKLYRRHLDSTVKVGSIIQQIGLKLGKQSKNRGWTYHDVIVIRKDWTYFYLTIILKSDAMDKNKNMECKFKVGDKAYKPKGYKFPCTIVSIFLNTKGQARIVAEMEDNGMLHIFNERQLEKIEELNANKFPTP